MYNVIHSYILTNIGHSQSQAMTLSALFNFSQTFAKMICSYPSIVSSSNYQTNKLVMRVPTFGMFKTFPLRYLSLSFIISWGQKQLLTHPKP